MQSMASWSTSSRHHNHPNVHQFIIIILDIIHIITIIISSITSSSSVLITIIRVSPPLGRYNAINGQVSILQSNTTCQTTEMQTHGWKNQMESYFCLSLKRPVSHKGQGMCKTSLRPAAAMSKVNMKRVQAGVSPPLFRAGPIAPLGGRQMYHILNIGARPGRLLAPRSTSDSTPSTPSCRAARYERRRKQLRVILTLSTS